MGTVKKCKQCELPRVRDSSLTLGLKLARNWDFGSIRCLYCHHYEDVQRTYFVFRYIWRCLTWHWFSFLMKLSSPSQKWRAFPETSARLVPSPFRRSSPTVHFWTRCLTSFVVELAIAEMACVSWNVRTTRSESLPAFQSNGPFLNAMSHILG